MLARTNASHTSVYRRILGRREKPRPYLSVCLATPTHRLFNLHPSETSAERVSFMSGGYEVVDEGHVGGQEQVESEWKTIRAVFHDFSSLRSKRGDKIESPVLECHGLKWRIQLFPGGDCNASEKGVFASLFLKSLSCSEQNITIKTAKTIRIPSARFSIPKPPKFLAHSPKYPSWGFSDYAPRSLVLDPSQNFLANGDLTVEVDIQVMLDKPPTWTPTNTVCSDMLKLLDDDDDFDNTDAAFEVGSEDKVEVFRVHSQILAARCPILLKDLAEGSDSSTPFPIHDVDPDIFRMMLRFVYGGEVPAKDILQERAKPILDASHKYGCTGLKLFAEASLASLGITTENAAELILFADGRECAMLREAAMDYFAKNAREVMASEGFKQLKGSKHENGSAEIMAELMDVALRGSKKRPASADADNDRDYKRMRVATLRKKLDDKKLDVDGSKEMLISRLEAADAETDAAAKAEAENDTGNDDEEADNDEVED